MFVFAPVLGADWLGWDDTPAFLETSRWRGLTREHLAWMWTTFHVGIYRPLTWMTYGADFVLWGMDGGAFHRTGLVLHTGNALLVFLLARRLLEAPRGTGTPAAATQLPALMAALFFAVHPLRAEAVGWISARADILATTFALITVLAYLRHTRAHPAPTLRSPWLWWATLAFTLSLLAKPMALALPAVLLVLDGPALARVPYTWHGWRALIVEKLPLIVVAAVMLPVILAAKAASATDVTGSRPLLALALTSYSLVFHAWKTFVPAALSPIYEMLAVVRVASPRFLGSILLVGGVAALLFRWRMRSTVVVAALLSYALLLLPVAGVIPYGGQIAADRYTYLPGIPLALLLGSAVAWIAARIVEEHWRRAFTAACVLSVAILGWCAHAQATLWADELALWQHAAAVQPHSSLANSNAALLLANQGEFARALPFAEQAVREGPTGDDNSATLAAILIVLEREDDARREIEIMRSGALDASEAYRKLGNALLAYERLDHAIDYYTLATAEDSTNEKAANALAAALAYTGRFDEAIPVFERVIALDSTFAPAHNNLGNALLALQRLPEAVAAYARAVALEPGNPDGRVNYADALVAARAFDEAEAQYRRAIALEPRHSRAHNNLGFVLYTTGRIDEAVTMLRRAMALDPDYPGARQNLEAAEAQLRAR